MNIIQTLKNIWTSFRASMNPPGQERPSPQNWIKHDLPISLPKEALLVSLTDDPVIVPVKEAGMNSMDPVWDAENRVILIQGANNIDHMMLVDYLRVGDVAVYRKPDGGLISHRIVDVDVDSQKKYFRFAGDNNSGIIDEQIVRPQDIAYIIVGVFY